MTVSDRLAMIACMTPEVRPGRWVYCSVAHDVDVPDDALAMMREAEGLTLILPVVTAQALGHADGPVMHQITLGVYSDLEGVGLTAAVAQALTDEGISCNVVAAYHHDHVLVPEADTDRAMAALLKTQHGAQTKRPAAQGTPRPQVR